MNRTIPQELMNIPFGQVIILTNPSKGIIHRDITLIRFISTMAEQYEKVAIVNTHSVEYPWLCHCVACKVETENGVQVLVADKDSLIEMLCVFWGLNYNDVCQTIKRIPIWAHLEDSHLIKASVPHNAESNQGQPKVMQQLEVQSKKNTLNKIKKLLQNNFIYKLGVSMEDIQVMTKLEKLYDTIKNLEELGIALPEDVLQQTANLEETLIKDEVVPVIRDTIAPVLGKIQRELTLVVDYKPGTPVNVLISRKGRIYKEGDFVQISVNGPTSAATVETSVSDVSEEQEDTLHHTYGPNKKKRKNMASVTRLRIIRRDGSAIQESNAAKTFVAAVKEAGYERVRELNLVVCKVPLVADKIDPVYGKDQKEITKGVYVITHCSTSTKIGILRTISESLKLGWIIEAI